MDTKKLRLPRMDSVAWSCYEHEGKIARHKELDTTARRAAVARVRIGRTGIRYAQLRGKFVSL